MAQSRKVALVTGAATGIGRAAAVALAEAGFDVVINYSRSEQAARTTAEQAQAKGAKTLLLQCDVSDDPCVRKIIDAATQEFGRLVGLRPGPQPLPYAASKAAVVSLTKLLALNLAPEIRVNAVAPGWMEGDWMVRMLKDKYDDLMGRRAKHTPLRRVATPEDVAEVIVNLIVSNRFVTGEIIVIDGGFAATT